MEQLKNAEAVINCKTPKLVKAIKVEGYSLELIADKLSEFVNLERFECSAGFEIVLPESLFGLGKLRHLTLSNLFLKQFPNKICDAFPLLETLNLSENYIATIPTTIRKLKQLRCLNFYKTYIHNLPKELLELPQLKSLILSTYDVTDELSVLLELKGLSELVLAPRLMKKMKKEHPNFINGIAYVYGNGKLERKKLKKILNQFIDLELSWSLRPLILNLMSDNLDKVRVALKIEDLLQACNFKGEEYIRLKALELLDEQMTRDNQNALAKDAEIAVMGRLGINKNELRQKLKDLNIKYSANITDYTTHVLLGQLPGERIAQAIEKGLFVLSEKNITDYWEQEQNPYLLEAVETSPEQLESMSALLLSGQEDSIAVALAMFKQGGFPKELITELFIAYFQLLDSTDAKREAERLLRQYGSSDLVLSMKTGSRLFDEYVVWDELALNRELMAVCKKTELDDLKIANYIYKKRKIGAAYLIRKAPEAEAIAFIRTHFLSSTGVLTLEDLQLRSIPKVLYKIAAEIKELKLKGNSIQKLTKDFKKFENLKMLDIRSNYDLLNWDVPSAEILAILNETAPNCEYLPNKTKKK